MSKDKLLTSLFGGQSHLLAAPMAAWSASSRRFTAFVTTFHTKIRKKLRAAQEPESLRDLQLELETAYLLLREKPLSLVYEPQPGRQARGPDFAVTFATSIMFMVEVTRLRADHLGTPPGAQEHALVSHAPDTPPSVALTSERLAGMLCRKLGQLLAQRSNLLLVGIEASYLTPDDLHAARLSVQQRAEGNDSAVVHGHGFRDRRGFFHHYQRLSAVLVCGTPLQVGEPVVVWGNPQAKYPLPSKVHTALSRSHTF